MENVVENADLKNDARAIEPLCLLGEDSGEVQILHSSVSRRKRPA